MGHICGSMYIFSGCRPKPLGAAAPTKSTLALHDSWMTYRCGHQAAVSGDSHQNGAAPTAEVINTHIASQVQQNAFTRWQRRVYALPPWRAWTCQPTLRSRSALAAPPEYASGPCSPPMPDFCVVFVSDEWAASWCPATRSKVRVTSGFPAAWRTMGDALVMWQGGHGSSFRHKMQAVGSLQRRNRFESHRQEFLTAVKAEP